jgi:hypothetical protein
LHEGAETRFRRSGIPTPKSHQSLRGAAIPRPAATIAARFPAPRAAVAATTRGTRGAGGSEEVAFRPMSADLNALDRPILAQARAR